MARTPTTTPAPATPSREDEVLIREIDEAVREDALYSFMRDHGMKVLGVITLGALIGIGLAGAISGWAAGAEHCITC